MSHTPTKYIAVPLLVEALYIEKQNEWLVNHGGCTRVLSDAKFRAQYTPFAPDKDDRPVLEFPVSIINP